MVVQFEGTSYRFTWQRAGPSVSWAGCGGGKGRPSQVGHKKLSLKLQLRLGPGGREMTK